MQALPPHCGLQTKCGNVTLLRKIEKLCRDEETPSWPGKFSKESSHGHKARCVLFKILLIQAAGAELEKYQQRSEVRKHDTQWGIKWIGIIYPRVKKVNVQIHNSLLQEGRESVLSVYFVWDKQNRACIAVKQILFKPKIGWWSNGTAAQDSMKRALKTG